MDLHPEAQGGELEDLPHRVLGTVGALGRNGPTRVPVQTLLDYLEGGESIDDFLEGFPSVKREQVVSFLELAKDRLIEASS